MRLVKDNTDIATIPSSAITEISYGQDVHRRVGAAIGLAVISLGIGGLMALTKSKKHYVGLTWVDGDKKGGFAMQCDKNEYRGILAALEAILFSCHAFQGATMPEYIQAIERYLLDNPKLSKPALVELLTKRFSNLSADEAWIIVSRYFNKKA